MTTRMAARPTLVRAAVYTPSRYKLPANPRSSFTDAVAGQVRVLIGTRNAVILAQLLGVSVGRARAILYGRKPITVAELYVLGRAVGKSPERIVEQASASVNGQ